MKLQPLQTLTGHSGLVWHCAWNPAGTLLATCGEDTHVRVWGREGDADEGRFALRTILSEGHTRTVRSLAWSACGKYLAAASFDGTVSVWERRDGQFDCMATLEGHENEVKGVAWARSGQFLATCSRDKSVWIWDVDEDEEEFMCASVLQAHTQDVKKVTWHPELDLVASCSYDNKIKLFGADGDDWTCLATLSSHTSTVWSLSFEASGRRLVSCSDDKTLKVWQEFPPGNAEGIRKDVDGDGDAPVWKCVCTLGGYHERCVYDVAWCPLTGLIASAGADDAVRVFREADDADSAGDAPGFDLAATAYCAHEQDVNCVAWNPKERGLLATCSDDGTVKLWRVAGEEGEGPAET